MKNKILITPYDEEILPIEETIKLPYYSGLVRIKKVLKKNMPTKACCHIATRIVHLREGLEELAGDYTAKTHSGNRLRRCHAWNYDPKRGLYIDITQDQFLETLPSIVVLPFTTDILTPTQEETWEQKADVFYKLLDELLMELQRGKFLSFFKLW